MRNLVRFFIRYHFAFAFILMESLCVILLYYNRSYQSSSILNSSRSISAKVYTGAANVKEYLLLKDENQILAQENAILKSRLKSSFDFVNTKEFMKYDTVFKVKYKYIAAKVVNNTYNLRSNYITINAGSNQGIQRDMAIVNAQGIVGLVKDVSSNFSSCLSFLHKDVRVNCQLKKDGSYGPLIWEGGDYSVATLTDIPLHARIAVGDTVITSPLSDIFPEGIAVGKVLSYERKANEALFTVQVKLSTEFNKLNHIYVIKNFYKAEQDSLEIISQTQEKDDK
jgi:rod shape-determining protein MreC